MPHAIERVLHAALHPIARQRHLVPWLAALLVMLALIPLVQAGSELIITPVGSAEMVERRVGTNVTRVSLDGLAVDVSVPAPAVDGATAGYYYFVRDAPAEGGLVVVQSPLPPSRLEARTVTGEVAADARVGAALRTELVRRGLSVRSAGPGARYLVEIAAPAREPRQIDSAATLDTLAVGTSVRLPLRFLGIGVATCAEANGTCDARALAGGRATFDQLAYDPAGRATVVVRTPYPPSLVRFQAAGPQVLDEAPIDALLREGPVSRLVGWGQVLTGAWVRHDPALPADRLWLGPILFLALAGLLVLGLRLGYPIFRPTGPSRWTSRPAATPSQPLAVRISGRLAEVDGRRLELDSTVGRLLPASIIGGPRLEMMVDGRRLTVALPAPLTGASAVEEGDLLRLRGRSPALWLRWFGNEALLVFDTAAARAAAETVVEWRPG